jgi:putative nucleotidyltransferase with HDIG domain
VELRELLNHLEETSEITLEALVTALDAREHETRAHSKRVGEYAVCLARQMGIHGEELETIRRGAMLHDIGKIGISDRILLKPSSLTESEWREMRKHPQIGYWILSGVRSLRHAAQIVLCHHERFDGGGYPAGLRGDAIALGARIFSAADSLDAMTSDRPYHRGVSWEEARREIAANAGGQFDPQVVRVFREVPVRTWEAIRERTLQEPVYAAPGISPVVLT